MGEMRVCFPGAQRQWPALIHGGLAEGDKACFPQRIAQGTWESGKKQTEEKDSGQVDG